MTFPGLEAEYTNATISPDGQYRYDLVRIWGAGPLVLWVMLNPSTADAADDDPTIRRCRAFSRNERAGGMVVVNLFAWRATDPAELRTALDPVGPDNEATIRRWTTDPEVAHVVCAWGANTMVTPTAWGPVTQAAADAGHLPRCLGTTKHGAPRHPLYVPSTQSLVRWP